MFFNDIGVVKNLIHYLKYRNQSQIGSFIGDWYGSSLKKDKGLPAIDMVLPVPMHPKKLKKRGYNQVEGFGKRLAHHLNAAYIDDILLKTTHTQTQTQKSRIFRWQHQSPSFVIAKPHRLVHKNILLVDDVVTTGATLEACAKAINEEKNTTIYIATMAMVP